MTKLRTIDFDLTMTRERTMEIEDNFIPETNLKSGLSCIFKHGQNDEINAIATYHNKAAYIKLYVEHLLEKSLTKKSVIDKETFSLHVYAVEGMPDFVIATVNSEALEYDDNLEILEISGKNAMIAAIQAFHDGANITETHFYDDDVRNMKMAMKMADVEAHYVDAEQSHFTIKPSPVVGRKRLSPEQGAREQKRRTPFGKENRLPRAALFTRPLFQAEAPLEKPLGENRASRQLQ